MRSFLVISILLLTIVGCKNFEDAKASDRRTFIKFFEGPYSMTASSVEITPTGYVILGNMFIELDDTTFSQTILIETDKNGSQIGPLYTFGGGIGKNFKPIVSGGAVTGYVIIGDSIYVDPFAEQAANVNIASLRLLILDNTFQPVGNFYLSDNDINATIKRDFFGGAVNVTPDGRVIILGTVKEGVPNQQAAPEKQLVIVLKSDFTLDWSNTFDLLDNTYQNSRSIQYTNDGNIIWATAISDVQGEFNSSWITIPYVKDSSIYDNFSQMGQTSQQLFVPKDIQAAHTSGFGFGVVGTYSQLTDGTKGNMFFLKIDPNGNILPGSDCYFDGINSFNPDSAKTSKNTSLIVDAGEALASTQDNGFVIAGSMTTNPQKGSGGKDIFLVKIDAFGNKVWSKILGSTGNEEVTSIRETAEGDLLICGSNTLGDYSSIFLMRTDRNGNITK